VCVCVLNTSSKVRRSEVKVTRWINAVIRSRPYLWNRISYKLQTWYSDGAERLALICTMTSKLKALHGCTSCHLQGLGAYRGGPTAVAVLVIVTMLVLIFSQQFQWCCRRNYPRRARSALGVDTVLTLDVCLFVCLYVCMLVL